MENKVEICGGPAVVPISEAFYSVRTALGFSVFRKHGDVILPKANINTLLSELSILAAQSLLDFPLLTELMK